MPDHPRVELLRALAVLVEAPDSVAPDMADALGLDRLPSAAECSDLFLFQLYPYASVHLGREGMIGGEARDRVAGFWRAVGIVPPAEPDHLAALLGLYASLAERESGADSDAERVLLAEAREALLAEHLVPWVFPLLERVGELGRDGAYHRWAELLIEVLLDEIGGGGEGGELRSTHLREAPGLPDPREGDPSDFLAGLMAPVRCGVIFTRADLAGIAARAGAGLRAGERRYALEHLLAQDAPAVLAELSGECRRQATAHDRRVARGGGAGLESASRFLGERARRAAQLLDELAAEGQASVTSGSATG